MYYVISDPKEWCPSRNSGLLYLRPRLARGPEIVHLNTGAAATGGVNRTVDMRDREPELSGGVPNVAQSMMLRRRWHRDRDSRRREGCH